MIENKEARNKRRRLQAFFSLMLILLMSGCTGGEESSPPTPDLPPTEKPPAGEQLTFDEQLEMIMSQIGPVAAGEQMTVSRSSSAEMTTALRTINEVSGNKVNAGLEFKKPDGSSIFMGFFGGIDVEGAAGAIEPMSFWMLEDGEVSQLNSAMLTADGAPNMVVGHFDFQDNVVDMTALVDDIGPEAVATAIAKIEAGTKPPSIVFIFSRSGDEVKAVYVRDAASGQYYQVDIAGAAGGAFAKLSLMPVEMLNNSPDGMWVLPMSMEAQLEGIDWDYRFTETGLEIFEVGGETLITRDANAGEWVSLIPVTDTPPAEEEITYTPEQQALLDKSPFYGFEFTQVGGKEVAHSPLDAADSPHYVFENGAWVDNHPGRNQLEANVFPADTDGQSIWANLERDGAVWDQDKMSYRYPDGTGINKKHPEYWQPKMALTDSAERDIDQGRVTFAETIESDDFVLGESGVSLDFFISTDHPGVKWWENLPSELSSKLLAESYLDSFPWLRGQKVAIRIVAESKTGGSNSIDRDTFAQEDGASLVGSWATGFTPDVAANTNLMTISLGAEGDELRSFPSNVSWATLWGLRVEQDGTMTEPFLKEGYDVAKEARLKLMDESGLPGPETASVSLK
jgi:hypothetical protein